METVVSSTINKVRFSGSFLCVSRLYMCLKCIVRNTQLLHKRHLSMAHRSENKTASLKKKSMFDQPFLSLSGKSSFIFLKHFPSPTDTVDRCSWVWVFFWKTKSTLTLWMKNNFPLVWKKWIVPTGKLHSWLDLLGSKSPLKSAHSRLGFDWHDP